MSDANDKTSKDPVGVPKAVVSRLSLYLRELQHWQREGKETVSSTQLG
ncbi:MAG: winged-helix domain-containing protein, partial [Planctomycetota bacterium]|nr:winged-helix domain-containing protein [Planctomycetota bacterium]